MSYNRSVVRKSELEGYLAYLNGVNPNMIRFTKVSDNKSSTGMWRHSCVTTGITKGRPVVVEYKRLRVEYIFCRCCGRINYYVDEV